MRARAARALTALALAGAACGTTPAEDGDRHFAAGRTLRIVVGYTAGGGYDINARLVARHIARHLGASAAVVENIPGAGGLLATRHLATVAARDGLTIGLLASNHLDPAGAGVAGSPAIVPDGGPRFALLGSPAPVLPACAFATRSGISDIAQWRRRAGGPPRIGTTGPGSISFVVATLLREAARLPVTLVSGYAGSGDAMLAIGSGEIEGFCATWETLGPHAGTGDRLVPVVRLAADHIPGFEAVPDILTVIDDPEARRLIELGIHAWNPLGRVYVAPPGVDPERVEALRAALAATFADPEFRRDAQAAGIHLQPLSGAAVERAFALATGDPAASATIRRMLSTR